MTMSVRLPVACLVAICQLNACADSQPVRYYTLTAIGAAGAANSAGASGQIKIRLEPVTIPPELDRLQIVRRVGPYSVRISDFDRWAAPLQEQIRRTLSDDLTARMPAGLIVDPDEPATSEPRRRLSVAIAAFSANDSCGSSLRAEWAVRAPGGEMEHGQQQVQVAGDASCTGGVPAAMSAALAQLADRLAAAL